MNWKYNNPKFEYEEKFQDLSWPWSGHKFFAYDLVSNIKPSMIVELGTHYGTSLWSFCQAVKDNKFQTKIFSVDTWKGEKHAGFYGEEVFETVNDIKDKYYNGVNLKLRRMTFDEALDDFEDNSIDILHIDGLHTYEVVKHDFENWIPKVKEGGVVLLHDIMVNRDDFGVYKLWEELKNNYKTIEFQFSYGLGILIKGDNSIYENKNELVNHYSYFLSDFEKEELNKKDFVIKQTAEVNNLKQKEIEEIKKIAEEKETIITEQEEEIKNLKDGILLKENEINAFKNSTSWKLTKPIRILKNKSLIFVFMIKKAPKVFKEEGVLSLLKKILKFLLLKVKLLDFALKIKKGVNILRRDGVVVFYKRIIKTLKDNNDKKKYQTSQISLMFEGDIKESNIAVVVHLFYTDLWKDIEKKLNNLPYKYQLIVSLTKGHFNQRDIKKIKKYKQNADILVLENKGMDVLPFLKSLERVDKKTKYILKIQSKKSLHAPGVGSRWFKDMLEHVLPKKEEVDLILHNLEYTDIGMIGGSIIDGCDRTFTRGEDREPKVSEKLMSLLLDYFGEEETNYKWISGTIFWTRFDIISKLADKKFIEFVEKNQPLGYSQDDTLVHAIERYFGKLVYDSGKIISLNPIQRFSKDYITLLPEKITSGFKKEMYLFFHICCMGNYDEVSRELIENIQDSGLYEKCSKIFYTILGVPNKEFFDWIKSFSKTECVYESTNLKEFEFPTLIKLQEFCKHNDAYVMYFHTKGVSNPEDQDKIKWRKRLTQKTIDEYSICVSFLNKGCDVSGCGWKEHPFNRTTVVNYDLFTHSHFSGNFWWSKSSYINQLPDLEWVKENYKKISKISNLIPPDIDSYRYMCEMWIGMKKGIKVGINGDLNKEYSSKKNKKMILFISHDNSMTGAPKIVFEIAKSLVHSPEYKVLLLCSDIKSNNFIDRENVFLRMNDLYKEVPFVYCDIGNENVVKEMIDKYKPDLLYANTVVTWKWIKYAILKKIPYIFHIHEKEKAIKEICGDYGDFFNQLKSENVITVSSSQKADLLKLGIKDPVLINEFTNTNIANELKHKKEILPNGLDISKPIIISIGSVSYRKGTDVFIETARSLPELQFLYIGGEYEKGILKDLPNNFFYIPQTDNVYYYLSISSLFALTSREEPFSLVVLDSLFLNIPVVCFKEGVGTADILSSLGNVIPGTVNASDLVSFIKNFDFNNKTYINNSEIVKSHYSQISQIPKIEEIIKTTISENKNHEGWEGFRGKNGIEIGGPSEVFKTLVPIYPMAKKIDGVNFSEKTLWDSRRAGKNSYLYFDNKKGDQYTLEASDLACISRNSYDFLLASHCLEHVANPIKTVKEWARVVKPGGFMVIIVPNKELCFDHNRDIVSFEHLFSDYVNDVGEDDLTHLDEILDKHDLSMDLPAGTKEQFKERSLQNFSNRGLHHHVFSKNTIEEIFSFLGITLENSFIDGINIVCIGRVSAYKKIFKSEDK